MRCFDVVDHAPVLVLHVVHAVHALNACTTTTSTSGCAMNAHPDVDVDDEALHLSNMTIG